MQKSIIDFYSTLSLYQVKLWISLCWKKVFMMRSPLLQQNCNRYFPFSFKPGTPCLLITPFHFSVSVPMCALKSPMMIVDLKGDTLSRASFTSSTKAWYSLAALRAYTCNRHIDWFSTLSFKMQTRDPKGIQSDTQSANRGLVSIPLPNCADRLLDQLRNRRLPPAIQVHSSRATSLGWKNSDNI